MRNYAPINDDKDVVTKEYVDNASVASAEKLTTDAGSSTVPVYFKDGKPTVCTYTLGSMCKESASDYEKAAVTAEKFAAVKNDIALNRTTLGTQCKNLLNISSPYRLVNCTLSISDTTATISSSKTWSRAIYAVSTIIGQKYKLTCNVTNYSSSDTAVKPMMYASNTSAGTSAIKVQIVLDTTGDKTYEFVAQNNITYIQIYLNASDTAADVSVSVDKLMLRDADILDDTYEPYTESVDTRITQNKSDIAINKSTLGYQCKNLLKNETGTTTMGGVTFTHNSDGSVTLNGTSDGQYFYTLMSKDFENILGKKCILTGCPANGSNSTFGIYIRVSTNDYIYDSGAGVTFTTDSIIWINIVIRGGVTFNNVTFYPMIRYADIIDDTYEPYTESVDERLTNNTSDIAINRTTLGYTKKNLHDTLSVNWYQPDKTSVASDGTVTATMTSDPRSFTYANSEHYITLEAGNYIITANTLEFVAGSSALIRGCNSDNQSLFALSVSSAGLHKAAFSLSEKTTIGIMYKLYSQTCTIMIRDADILDDTYEVYKANVNERLIEDKSNITINKSTLGYTRKNLLKNTAETKTINNVTFTVNSDSSITATQTTTNPDNAVIDVATNITLSPGTYILTGDDEIRLSGFGAIRFYINGTIYSSNTVHKFYTEVTISRVTIFIWKGVNINGSKTVYPMLRYADITDSTYEPYQPSLLERCLLKDTAGISLGAAQSSSITIDNLSTYTALWVNVSGNVSGINFKTNLVVPVAYLAKSTSNSVQLAGGIPSSAYITSDGVQAAKNMDGTITAKVSGNTLSLTIGTGTIGSIEVVSLM